MPRKKKIRSEVIESIHSICTDYNNNPKIKTSSQDLTKYLISRWWNAPKQRRFKKIAAYELGLIALIASFEYEGDIYE